MITSNLRCIVYSIYIYIIEFLRKIFFLAAQRIQISIILSKQHENCYIRIVYANQNLSPCNFPSTIAGLNLIKW